MNWPQSHRGTEPEDLSDPTAEIIRCAIEVHRLLINFNSHLLKDGITRRAL